jgi:hypothetical protein
MEDPTPKKMRKNNHGSNNYGFTFGQAGRTKDHRSLMEGLAGNKDVMDFLLEPDVTLDATAYMENCTLYMSRRSAMLLIEDDIEDDDYLPPRTMDRYCMSYYNLFPLQWEPLKVREPKEPEATRDELKPVMKGGYDFAKFLHYWAQPWYLRRGGI